MNLAFCSSVRHNCPLSNVLTRIQIGIFPIPTKNKSYRDAGIFRKLDQSPQ